MLSQDWVPIFTEDRIWWRFNPAVKNSLRNHILSSRKIFLQDPQALCKHVKDPATPSQSDQTRQGKRRPRRRRHHGAASQKTDF